jgi:hypothetical protein
MERASTAVALIDGAGHRGCSLAEKSLLKNYTPPNGPQMKIDMPMA